MNQAKKMGQNLSTNSLQPSTKGIPKEISAAKKEDNPIHGLQKISKTLKRTSESTTNIQKPQKMNSEFLLFEEKEPITRGLLDWKDYGTISMQKIASSRSSYIQKLREDLSLIDEQLKEKPITHQFLNPLRVFRRMIPNIKY